MKKEITITPSTLPPRTKQVILTITNKDDKIATVNIRVEPEDTSFDELIKSPCGALTAAILQILSGLFDYNPEGYGQSSIFRSNLH